MMRLQVIGDRYVPWVDLYGGRGSRGDESEGCGCSASADCSPPAGPRRRTAHQHVV